MPFQQRHSKNPMQPKTVYIKIDTQPSVPPPSLQNTIRQAKRTVIRGQIALEESRRRGLTPDKSVDSDRMTIMFNYEESRRKMEIRRIKTPNKTEEEGQTDRTDQSESQGIQLPLHIDQNQKRLISHIDRLNNIDPARDFGSHPRSNHNNHTCRVDQFLTARSIERLPFNPKASKQITTKVRLKQQPFKDRGYRINFGKSKEMIHYKQNFNRSLENKKNHHFRTEQFSLQQSYQRLPIYYPVDRSKSKEILNNIKKEVSKQHIKATVKLNKPHLSLQQPKQSQKNKMLRPRYQIEVPAVLTETTTSLTRSTDAGQPKDWINLKQQVETSQLIKKYLSDSELFEIYDFLKRNKVSADKWPLFIAEEAFKKMEKTR